MPERNPNSIIYTDVAREMLARWRRRADAFITQGSSTTADVRRAAAYELRAVAQELESLCGLADEMAQERLQPARVIACTVCGRGFDPNDPQQHALTTGHQPDVVVRSYPGVTLADKPQGA